MNELKSLIHAVTDTACNNTTATKVDSSNLEKFTNSAKIEPMAQYGWICPKCGAVMAPNQTSCTFCFPIINVTTTAKPPVSPVIICTGQPYDINFNGSTTSNT